MGKGLGLEKASIKKYQAGLAQGDGRTKLWQSDDELFAIAKRELFTCVVGDVMDKMRLPHQFLPPPLRMTILC